jgi:hypothetical protein
VDARGNIVKNSYGDPIVVGPGRKALLGDALRCAVAAGAPAKMDADDLNPYFIYRDKDHKDRAIYMLDAATAYNEVIALGKYRPRGGALWYLGAEDPSIWSFFAVGKLGGKANASDFGDVSNCPTIIYSAEGQPGGHRSVVIGKDGLIRSETYVK